LTGFRLRQRGRETEIAFEPQLPRVDLGPRQRAVTVRVHLPAGTSVGSVRRNGQALDHAVIAPADGPVARLFTGPGAPPPSESGPVVEWRGDVDAAEAVGIRIVCADS
jgi:hypothetical protein